MSSTTATVSTPNFTLTRRVKQGSIIARLAEQLQQSTKKNALLSTNNATAYIKCPHCGALIAQEYIQK